MWTHQGLKRAKMMAEGWCLMVDGLWYMADGRRLAILLQSKFNSKILSPLGWPPKGKNQNIFFSFFDIRMTYLSKWKLKKIFKLFDPQNFITPLGWPQWRKNQKKFFFFDFSHQNDSIRKKNRKNFFQFFQNFLIWLVKSRNSHFLTLAPIEKL